MIHIHIVANKISPAKGGLEQSIFRIANFLSSINDFKVYLYIRNQPSSAPITTNEQNIYVYDIYKVRQNFFEPYGEFNNSVLNTKSKETESNRLDFLILRNVIKKFIDTSDDNDHHLIMSFYISNAGFLCQHVVDDLNIPHIACVRGTDFSRDLYGTNKLHAIEWVLKKATRVVTTNRDHLEQIKKIFKRDKKVSIIYNSVNSLPSWTYNAKKNIKLISDGGLSFKKGTHILLKSFETLIKNGYLIDITIIGEIEEINQRYWEKILNNYYLNYKNRFNFYNYLEINKLTELILKSDLYCLPTLGEGCSNSRVRALCMGIPVVSTMTGELKDVLHLFGDNSFIRACQPGDEMEFSNILEEMVNRISDNILIQQNKNYVSSIKRLFSSDQEKNEWERIIRDLFKPKSTLLKHSQKRILFFVHDGSGLGHLNRISLIAKALQGSCCSCLIVSGQRASSWIVPKECEYVHLPSLDSLLPNRSKYWGLSPFIDLEESEAFKIRKEILNGVISGYKPDAIIVDYLPLGKKDELADIIKNTPAKKYYIARGFMDHAGSIKEILEGRAREYLEKFYNKIFVACDDKIYFVKEYEISLEIEKKVQYVGYVAESITNHEIQQTRLERGIGQDDIWIVCSAGGGKLGEEIIKYCMEIATQFKKAFFDIIIGPRSNIQWPYLSVNQAVNENIRLHKESGYLKYFHGSADIVICPGGYNSLVEAMQGKAHIICYPSALKTSDEQYFHPLLLSKFVSIKIVTDPVDLQKMLTDAIVNHQYNNNDERTSLNFNGAFNIRQHIFEDMGIQNYSIIEI